VIGHGPKRERYRWKVKTRVRFFFKIQGSPSSILEPAGCNNDVSVVDPNPFRPPWVTVTVWLDENDDRLPLLLQQLAAHKESWLEHRWDEYTDEELDSAPLLIMQTTDDVEVFAGPRLGTTYDMSKACPTCGAGAQQTSPLLIDAEGLPKLEKLRVASSYYSDIIVDERLAAELDVLGIKGLTFSAVYAITKDKRQIKLPWRQLRAAHTMPLMSPRSTGIERIADCPLCKRSGLSSMVKRPTRLAYRAEDLDGAEDVNTTWEWFGDVKFNGDVSDALFAYPWFLVTPKVMRILRNAGAPGFDWLPIRVIEE